MADHLRTELVAGALSNAVAARDPDPGVIFHRQGLSVHLCQIRCPRPGQPGGPVHRAYNGARHSALGYQSPPDHEKNHRNGIRR